MRRATVAVFVVVLVIISLIVGSADARVAPAVRIGGPHKLKAARVLEFPVFVSADSAIKVRGALRLPGPNISVNIQGTIRRGHPKKVKLTLYGPARHDLKDGYRGSSLKIVVTARNLLTNIKHTARKTFRFKR